MGREKKPERIYSRPDLQRKKRRCFSEVVFGEGKEIAHLREVVQKIYAEEKEVLITRLSADRFSALHDMGIALDYDPVSRTAMAGGKRDVVGEVAVITAGTADVAVAEECMRTLAYFGIGAKSYYDVGVAGIHRLFDVLEAIRAADCAVVCAGMDGALPSVTAGLVDIPVIAVPTSVGYGASFQGMAALLSMLNSCAEGIAAVNIDNGFGAAYMAAQIVKAIYEKRK